MHQSAHTSRQVAMLAGGLLPLAGMLPAPALAAWNVNDATAQGHLEKIREYTLAVRDYYEKHGQQGRPVTRVISAESWPAGTRMPTVGEDFALKHSCGNKPTLTAAHIKSRLASGFSLADNATHEQIGAEQLDVCGAIRVLANIRYNESVELVNTTLPAIKRKYEESVLKGINDNGNRGFDNAGANQVSLQAAQFEFDLAITTFRERQSQYEQYQGLLVAYNDQLGRRVLNGGGNDDPVNGLVGSLIGASVVQAALRLGN